MTTPAEAPAVPPAAEPAPVPTPPTYLDIYEHLEKVNPVAAATYLERNMRFIAAERAARRNQRS